MKKATKKQGERAGDRYSALGLLNVVFLLGSWEPPRIPKRGKVNVRKGK